MYRKDFIEAEIQKLIDALARIIGLKKEGNTHAAHSLSHEALASEFGFEQNFLDTVTSADFEAALVKNNLSEI